MSGTVDFLKKLRELAERGAVVLRMMEAVGKMMMPERSV